MKVTERDIQIVLNMWALPCLGVHNCHIFGWESDFLQVTRSAYAYEYEIKMSRSDFRADFKKADLYGNKRHDILSSPKPVEQNWNGVRPARRAKRFTFVTAEGIVTEKDIPEYAGWWEFPAEVENYRDIRVMCRKSAPNLKKGHKLTTDEIMRLMRNVTWRYWDLAEEKRKQESQGTIEP